MNDFKHYRGRGRGSYQHNNFRGTFHNPRRANQNAYSPILPLPHFRENKNRWQRPPHPWRNGPPRMPPPYMRHLPPPYMQQRSPMVETRAVSPLPGSEEARQKVIAEASARIKEQLNLNEDGVVRSEQNSLPTVTCLSDNKFEDDIVGSEQISMPTATCFSDDKFDDKFQDGVVRSAQIAVPTLTSFSDDTFDNKFNDKFDEDVYIVDQTVQKPPEKLKRRTKKGFTEPDKSVEELRNKILTQFTYMSKGKIQSLVNNPGSSKYDGYLQHLVRDMRLHLSSELRNMYNNRETTAENNEMIDRFNSIVPDLGVELVSLPDTMVAELSKILQFDNEVLSSPINTVGNENTLVEPEDMFKQAEKLLLNTDFLNPSFEGENLNQPQETAEFLPPLFETNITQTQDPPEFLEPSFDSHSQNFDTFPPDEANLTQTQDLPEFLGPSFEDHPQNLDTFPPDEINLTQTQDPPGFLRSSFEAPRQNFDTFPPDFTQNPQIINNDPFMHRSPLCNEPPPNIPFIPLPSDNFPEPNFTEQNLAPIEDDIITPADMEIEDVDLATLPSETSQFIEHDSNLDEIPLPEVEFPTQADRLKTPSRDSSPFSKKILEANMPESLEEPTYFDQSRVRSSSIPASNPFVKSPNYSSSPQMRSESNESRVPEKSTPKLFNFDSVWLFNKSKIENVTSFLDDVVGNTDAEKSSTNIDKSGRLNKNSEEQNKNSELHKNESPVFTTNITQNKTNLNSKLDKNIPHKSAQPDKTAVNPILNTQQTPVVENIVNPAEILKSLNTILAQAQNIQHGSKKTIDTNLFQKNSKALIKSLKSISNINLIKQKSPQTTEKIIQDKPTVLKSTNSNLPQNSSQPKKNNTSQNKPNDTEKSTANPRLTQHIKQNTQKPVTNTLKSKVIRSNVNMESSKNSSHDKKADSPPKNRLSLDERIKIMMKMQQTTPKKDEPNKQKAYETSEQPQIPKSKNQKRKERQKQMKQNVVHERKKVKVRIENKQTSNNNQSTVSTPTSDIVIKQEKIDSDESSEENKSQNMNNFIKNVKDLNKSLISQHTTVNQSIFAGKPPSLSSNDITQNVSMNAEENKIIQVRKNFMPTKAALKVIPPIPMENVRTITRETEKNISDDSSDAAKTIEYRAIRGIKIKRKEHRIAETNENTEKQLPETVSNNEETINENQLILEVKKEILTPEKSNNQIQDKNIETHDVPEQSSSVLTNDNRNFARIEGITAIVHETVEENKRDHKTTDHSKVRNEKKIDSHHFEEIITEKNISPQIDNVLDETKITDEKSQDIDYNSEISRMNFDKNLTESGPELYDNNSGIEISDLAPMSAKILVQENLENKKINPEIDKNINNFLKINEEEINTDSLSFKEIQDNPSTDKSDQNKIDKINQPNTEIESIINKDVIVEKENKAQKQIENMERDTERPKSIEREKSMEIAKHVNREKSMEREKHTDREKSVERAKHVDRERSMERAKHTEREKSVERARHVDRERSIERAKHSEREKSLERAKHLDRDKSMEREKHTEREKSVDRAKHVDRERSMERAKHTEREKSVERAKHVDRERSIERAKHTEREKSLERAKYVDRATSMDRTMNMDREKSMERVKHTDREKSIERAKQIDREKSMERAKHVDREMSKERGKSLEKTKNNEREKSHERNKHNERHKSKEREERKDKRKHRSHSRERSKDSKHKDEKKSRSKDCKHTSDKHETKKDEIDHKSDKHPETSEVNKIKKSNSKPPDNKSRSKHNTDKKLPMPKRPEEIKTTEDAIIILPQIINQDKQDVLIIPHSTSSSSQTGDNQSIINRLMEIDLQIQKLMQEKWHLYKQLNNSNSSAITMSFPTVHNQQPVNESIENQHHINETIGNQRLVKETIEIQQPIKEIPETTSIINETLKIRPVSTTPSETSTLSEYSKKHFNSRGMSLPRSESSLNDLEKHETDDEITEKNIPKRKKEKLELKSQIYRLSLEKNKAKNKIDDENESDIDSPLPPRKRKRGKSPVKRDTRSRKVNKNIDSESEPDMPVKKRGKIDKKPVPKKNNKSVKKDSKAKEEENSEINETAHIEQETPKISKKIVEQSLDNKRPRSETRAKKKIEFPKENIITETEPETIEKQPEIVEKEFETVGNEPETIELKAMEKKTGTVEKELKIVEKQIETVEKHSGTVENHPVTVEKSPARVEKHPETIEHQLETVEKQTIEKKSSKKRKKKSSINTSFIEDEQEEEPNQKFFIKIRKPEKKNPIVPKTIETEKLENKEIEVKPVNAKIPNKRQRRKQKDEIPKEEINVETENNHFDKTEAKLEENAVEIVEKRENLNNNNESEKEKKPEYKIKVPENANSIKLKIVKSEVKPKEDIQEESTVEKPSLRRSRRSTTEENISHSSENLLIAPSSAPASVKKKRAKKTEEETARSRSRSTSKESDIKNIKVKHQNDSSDEEDSNKTFVNRNKRKQPYSESESESSHIDEKIGVDKKINAKRKRKISKEESPIVEINKIVPEVVKKCFVKLERINIPEIQNIKEDEAENNFEEDIIKEADKEIDDIIAHFDDKLEDTSTDHVFIIPSPVEKEIENKIEEIVNKIEEIQDKIEETEEDKKEEIDLEEIEDFKGYDKADIPDVQVQPLVGLNPEIENEGFEVQPLVELNPEIENEGFFCSGHRKSILDIKVLGDEFLAASEDGTIYKYCLKTGELQDAYTGHKRAVTCMYLMSGKILDLESTLMYTGSLDCSLKCYNIDTAEILHSVIVAQAIQCMDSAWGYIFLGTYEGLLFIYDIKKKLLNDQSLTIANATVLMIKATQEGSRQVLILASRKREIMVRDAFTGLLLRTMCQDQKPTIYSLLLDRSMVYCGTSDKGILILDFHNGMQTGLYNSGKGVVCMVMYKTLLFAGCYDGMIYIYNTKTQKHIITLPGPGEGMLLSLAISDGLIIAGTKKDHLLKIWKIPQEIINEID